MSDPDPKVDSPGDPSRPELPHQHTHNILLKFPRYRLGLGMLNGVCTDVEDGEERAREELTFKRLEAWKQYEDRKSSWGTVLNFKSWNPRRPQKPQPAELASLAKYHFKPRGQTRVLIFDFGDGRAEKREIKLGEIEKAMKEKPDWATVRWIHAPLGTGLFHSSVEQIFLEGGPDGRYFDNAGRACWPYLETEILNLRNFQDCKNLQEIAQWVSEDNEATALLEKDVFAGDENPELQENIEWRAGHLNMDIRFWESTKSDIPWQMSEDTSRRMFGPNRGSQSGKTPFKPMVLSKNAIFEKTHLVRNPFRFFHRADGYILTLSPSSGVDYLSKSAPEFLKNPAKYTLDDEHTSAVLQVFSQFSDSGTSNWYRKTAEWLLVYIITEIGATPHSIREGFSMPSITEAYETLVWDLKMKRHLPWKRNETARVVQDYLDTMDEINFLLTFKKKKLDMHTRLILDCNRFELEDNQKGKLPDCPEGDSYCDRIQFSTKILKEDIAHCEQLITDLTSSLNTLFQLRSIEQNERAMITDKQNKALFVFTGVTIVFLPLSFFTSYYGMNIQGIVDTTRGEEYFWKLCGSIGLGVVLVTIIFAFRQEVQSRIWRVGMPFTT